MSDQNILKDKRLLVVDDEVDMLEVIKDEFPNSIVTTASQFESGLKLINEGVFDLIILDIMGVDGFELLKACGRRHLPAASYSKSYQRGEHQLGDKRGRSIFLAERGTGQVTGNRG